uniref:GDT1 family protein n=1 Tax=Schistosoma japonicum TaxID=6182 RepID=C7TYP0_SCHJA|nr:Transmembrane protein 165 [Schistosoma japonicum]
MRFLFVCFFMITVWNGGCCLEVRSYGTLPTRMSANDESKPSNKINSAWDLFFSGFSSSLYVIIISELGDKTFFIAAIMSMQHPRALVYCGAMFALITMTMLSALLGYATTIVPRFVTLYLSGVLFLIFGIKMLYEAYTMSSSSAKDEFDEVHMQITQSKSGDIETGTSVPETPRSLISKPILIIKKILTPIFVEAFVLTFLAEWGDRSQITTIVLAATKSALGVIVGGVLGHALCTGLAVLMGRFVAQRIPVQWITFIGGVTFIIFAFSVFFGNPDTNS